MKKLLIIGLLALGLVGCNSNKVEEPQVSTHLVYVLATDCGKQVIKWYDGDNKLVFTGNVGKFTLTGDVLRAQRTDSSGNTYTSPLTVIITDVYVANFSCK